MRCFFVCTLALFFCSNLIAQQNDNNDDIVKTFTKVELNAEPDAKAWADYLKKASRLPTSVAANIPAGVYKITVQFIVDVYGNLGSAEAKNNPGYGLAKRAEKIILSYDGVWKPANQCGRNVKSYKNQVVEFVVKKEL
ncbi:MAG: hypothetical protein QM726_22115 [Chitinophagaceae bacterium]